MGSADAGECQPQSWRVHCSLLTTAPISPCSRASSSLWSLLCYPSISQKCWGVNVPCWKQPPMMGERVCINSPVPSSPGQGNCAFCSPLASRIFPAKKLQLPTVVASLTAPHSGCLPVFLLLSSAVLPAPAVTSQVKILRAICQTPSWIQRLCSFPICLERVSALFSPDTLTFRFWDRWGCLFPLDTFCDALST